MKKNRFLFITTVLIFSIIIILSPMIISNLLFKPEYTYAEDPMSSISEEYALADNETKFYGSAIKNSTQGVVGTFSEYYYKDKLHTWIFKTEKVIYGKNPGSTIKIVNPVIDYSTNENPIKPDTFTEGKSYILFLRGDESLFLDEPQYGLLGSAYIPLDDLNSSTWSRGKISFGYMPNSDTVMNYYANLAKSRGFNENKFTIEAFYNKELDEVVVNSKVVLKVFVKCKSLDSVMRKQSIYEIDILDILQGSEFVTDEDTSFIVNVCRDSLEEGKEYILTLSLCDNSEKHSSFTQSAQNGIIPIEDTETVEKVYEWLDIK